MSDNPATLSAPAAPCEDGSGAEIDPAAQFAYRTTVVEPGEGEVLSAFGDTVQVRLGPEQTGGKFTLALSSTPPGAGPPPHRHANEDELFMALQGTYSFLVSGEWRDVAPGGVIYAPKGVVHTFHNNGDTICRAWIVATPCGFEHFFAQSSQLFAAASETAPPDFAKIMEISTAHGIEYVPGLGLPLE